MKLQSLVFGLPCVLLLALGGCGGGGGGGSSTPSPSTPVANTPPTASAGPGLTVDGSSTVTLDGSDSRDSDGVISTWLWVQTDGPSVVLEGSDSATATFVAPELLDTTSLSFSLTVTDDDGDSSSASVTVTVRASTLPRVALAGRILPAVSQGLDSDTNDPFNPFVSNDDPASPQPLGNPATVGGYVNEEGTGAEGRSQIDGDREDYYVVELLDGQTLNLLVAEFQDADADLYLYSEDGELVDFSIETGELETIRITKRGTYLVNVSIFNGATNYTLAIGSSLEPDARHYGDVIPNQLIVRNANDRIMEDLRNRILRDRGAQQIGGGHRRARLVALEEPATSPGSRSRLRGQDFRRSQFRDLQKARRWDTLLTIKGLNLDNPDSATFEPNYRVYPHASVNDEAYRFQWHYSLINVPGAWDTSTGSADIVVAVVDTGVLPAHPDLAGQLVDGYDFIRDPDEAADGDGIDPNPQEDIGDADPGAINFHGTHVAGTVAAAGNNGIGVAGLAYGSRVMPLRAINASGGTLYDVNQAIRYAAGLENDSGTVPQNPARVINLSLGGGGFSASSQDLYNELRSLGIVVVAAAGNESSSAASYPASYANVISVTAVDAQQRITSYSNTGVTVDISAPGGDGSVDLNGDGYPDGILSTGGSDGEHAYTFLSGTSMASPHVAGVVALMLSVNPELDGDDIDRLLGSGALTDDIGETGRDDLYGYGLINARKALDAALSEAGDSSSAAPRLTASASALSFGSTATTREVLLRNGGGGDLDNVSVSADQPWLTVDASLAEASGLGTYGIRVDRDGLAAGVYEGSLRATSSANSVTIRVLLSVADTFDSDLGQIYLLVFDPELDEVVAQAAPTLSGGEYRYELPEVLAGSYQIFAGTDIDNDLLICDAGEACGAYLTIDQPLTVDLAVDRDDLDFPIEFLIALPVTGSATNAENARIGTYRSLEREAETP